MRLGVLCFVAGAWLLQQQPTLPETLWVWPAAAAAGLALHRLLGCGRSWLACVRLFLLLVSCFALGFGWAAWRAQERISDSLPPEWEGRDLVIVGVVAGLPQDHGRGVRFEFDIERVETPGARLPRRVVLSWWGSPAREGRPATYPQLRPGERWQLAVRLKRPRGTANPHGFDYEAWLFERDLRATGYVRARPGGLRLEPMVHRPVYWIERARDLARERVRAALPQAPYAGVIAALAVGDQRAIAPEQWQTFTRTGVNHLMSISGLHVTMVSGLVFALVYRAWRRSPRLALRLPAVKAAALAGLAAAFAYTLLAGFAIPAQRTLYMLAVVAAALWLGLVESGSVVLCAALWVVVLADPWAVLAPGFWLSFGAVAAIFYISNGRLARPGWLAGWTRTQAAVTLALLAPLIALFQLFPVVSPLANAMAIPVISLVVVPLALLGLVSPFDLVLQAAHAVMSGCMVVLEGLAAVPEAIWQQSAPAAWAVALAVAATAWLLAPRGIPARWLGATGMVPLLAAAPPALEVGDADVVVLDVGQGMAAVVRTARHALLYDTGASFGPDADSATRTILPYLRAAGIARLDVLIVSHDDDDHTGGARSVMQALPVALLLTSLPDADPLVVLAERALRCQAGLGWQWDGVRFELIHPRGESYGERTVKDNDRSCVLKIEARGGSVLLPADIERRSEQELLQRARERLRADVLVAPHQGSRTSSTPEFIEAVAPLAVVFPVGYRNRFGHPHPEIEQRYRERGTRIFRSDRDGAVSIALREREGITMTPYRARYRRYWQTVLPGDPVAEAVRFAPAGARTGAGEP
jgi:competence protein ComEC